MSYPIRTASGPIQALLKLPGSEAISYRALLSAALADGVSEVSGLPINDNIKTFIHALRQVGIVAQLDTKSSSCIIAGGSGKLPLKQASLWCANSKLITYFLMATCSISPGVYHLDGSATLRELVLTDYLTLLHTQGADMIPNDIQHLPLTLLGSDSLEGGEIDLPAPVNSHLVSALLMISPYARTPVVFNVPHLLDQDAVELTCSMMAEFGVLVHRVHQGQFMVPVPQRYQARDYVVEADLPLAAYFFAAAAITGGEIRIQPIARSSSKQPAIKFLSLLEKMGCRITENQTNLTVIGPSELKGIEVSLRDFSDIFFALAALAPFATSPTRITHIGKMNPHETAALAVLKNKFTRMEITTEGGEDWIKIFPSKPKSITVNRHDDHRIAMALVVMGLKVPGIALEDLDCIALTHPNFFELWNKLVEEREVSV